MNHGIGRLDLTGKDVTDRLIKLLGQRGYSFESKIERENVRLTKESLCSIGLKSREVETAASNSDRKTHGCPNSTSYLIGDEPRECSEILFDPKSIGRKVGIHQILADSIVKCDIGIQQDLCDNIILAGGTTNIKGFRDSLQQELKTLITNQIHIPRSKTPGHK